MRILAIHSDFIEIEPKKKALKSAKEVSEKLLKSEDCLVVFSAAEKKDEQNPEAVARNLVKEVKDICQQVSSDNVVLYPYVHLTSQPSSPDVAEKILDLAAKELKKSFNLVRAPFGWYKAFNIKCKGHPLSELSREFGPEEVESNALKAEKTLKSYWYILDKSGKLAEIEIKEGELSGFNFSKYKNLERFARYELAKSRTSEKVPLHVPLMKRLGLVRYEPASDPGNFTYLPAGKMIKSLIEEKVSKTMQEYGGLEVETPIMYDLNHPTLKSYLNRFPARQYTVKSPNKELFLRFAACFGQFLMAADTNLSYKHLPFRMYELTRYSFRAEQRGELAGLRRLRAFTMPDCHALCTDEKQAKEEMLKRFAVAKSLQSELGLDMPEDLEMGIRVTQEFYNKNKDFVTKLVKEWGKPALIEMWDKQFFYFVLKYEWNFVDSIDKAAALTTDQIDVVNSENYGINYIDAEGKKQHPLILHLSPSGAVERVMYALLEKAGIAEKQGKTAMLPLWLAPTQVRICPVSDEFISAADKLASQLEKENIRVDIDDRAESVGKKVSLAEQDWVPFTIVYGAKEKGKKVISVRVRSESKVKNMSVTALIKEVKSKVVDKPNRTVPLPRLLSKRPSFAF